MEWHNEERGFCSSEPIRIHTVFKSSLLSIPHVRAPSTPFSFSPFLSEVPKIQPKMQTRSEVLKASAKQHSNTHQRDPAALQRMLMDQRSQMRESVHSRMSTQRPSEKRSSSVPSRPAPSAAQPMVSTHQSSQRSTSVLSNEMTRGDGKSNPPEYQKHIDPSDVVWVPVLSRVHTFASVKRYFIRKKENGTLDSYADELLCGGATTSKLSTQPRRAPIRPLRATLPIEPNGTVHITSDRICALAMPRNTVRRQAAAAPNVTQKTKVPLRSSKATSETLHVSQLLVPHPNGATPLPPQRPVDVPSPHCSADTPKPTPPHAVNASSTPARDSDTSDHLYNISPFDEHDDSPLLLHGAPQQPRSVTSSAQRNPKCIRSDLYQGHLDVPEGPRNDEIELKAQALALARQLAAGRMDVCH